MKTKGHSPRKLAFILLSMACVACVATATITVIHGRSLGISDLPTAYAQGCFIYDVNDPQLNSGFADYIFVGRVVKILRTEQEGGLDTLETVYEVDVVKNLKGELQSTIAFYKGGGITQKGALKPLGIGREVVCYAGDFLPLENDVCIFYATAQEDGRLTDIGGPNSNILLPEIDLESKGALEENQLYKDAVLAIENQVVPELKIDCYTANFDASKARPF